MRYFQLRFSSRAIWRCLYNDMNYVILYSFRNFSILIIIRSILPVFDHGQLFRIFFIGNSLLESAMQYVSMFTRSTNNTYQVVEQLPDLGRLIFHSHILNINVSSLGWRYNKSYFLATKTGASKDDRYLISWVCIFI